MLLPFMIATIEQTNEIQWETKMKNGQSHCLMDEASLEQTRHVSGPLFDGHVMDKCETE